MTNFKSTKRALMSSIIALFICFSMLLGTTFAWFTDSAVSADNKIIAGTLDVQLFQWTSDSQYKNISDSHDPVFTDSIRWEPGMTEVVYLSIKNGGTLALKYQVALDVTDVSDHSLTDVMSYAITPDAHFGDVKGWAGNGTKVVPGSNATQADDVVLLPGQEHFFALSVHMDEETENKYMGHSITFDIRVLAGQLVHENDSFGPNYDKLASYPGKGYADPIPVGGSAAEILITDDDGYKVGSVVIPAAAAESGASFTAEVTKSFYNHNFTVASGMEMTKYDVKVTGLKENNDTPVKVELKIAAGLDPATVKLYHIDTEIDCVYNPNTGYVTFETATFSPFAIVYDAESVYVPEDVDSEDKLPQAGVVNSPEYENVDLPWGSYGAWSPTKGLSSHLEAAYTFSCLDTAEEIAKSPYAQWYCDFVVVLDKDLGANEIFLGGNYGSFGWVGFHNGDLTLEANTEIPLLGSVTSNPWTYQQVAEFVGTFICGVGDVDDALAGATFTVMLRLTNTENEAEFYNVATIEYTFN